MTRVTVAKVKRFPTPEDKLAVCYVGRAAWGWPGTPWANPFKPRPTGFDIKACLDGFREFMETGPPEYLEDLWAACRQGDLPLACWCYAGDADGGVGVCHAAILACELNRRFVDPLPVPECPR